MADATQIITHDLDPELAKKAAQKAFAGYTERFERFAPTATWTGEQEAEIAFTVKGVKLQGKVDLKPAEIHLRLEVPLLFRPFRKKALHIIESQIEEWVARAKSGELDD